MDKEQQVRKAISTGVDSERWFLNIRGITDTGKKY